MDTCLTFNSTVLLRNEILIRMQLVSARAAPASLEAREDKSTKEIHVVFFERTNQPFRLKTHSIIFFNVSSEQRNPFRIYVDLVTAEAVRRGLFLAATLSYFCSSPPLSDFSACPFSPPAAVRLPRWECGVKPYCLEK